MKDQSLQVQTSDAESPWQKTSYTNLIRYASSGCYFARIKIGSKLIRQSLKTKVLTVAKLKLSDLEKREHISRWLLSTHDDLVKKHLHECPATALLPGAI